MNSFSSTVVLLFFLFAFCLQGHAVFAFGAGNIPSFAYIEGKAFRHGDIEDAISELVKHSASGFALASLISKGSKFSSLDVKRVYFGNWLRDYSQAVDIAGLKKLQLQSIITLCMVLGFLAHGYVTAEFEVTAERLGVYLPVEHIDNPKGYGQGEDARRYHPKLRGPVNPRELEVDSRTGMKNYIANEHGGWDTSKAHVRRVLQECIRYGRMYRSQRRKEDEYEAFRLLGTALHTLEDFTAHSNFCELALVSMGHTQVFTHVGDNVRVQARNGKWVAPIVTGTFGSSDFMFSLLGEATDHLSEASVADLNKELDKARSRSQGTRGNPGFDPASALRSMLFSVPGGAGESMARDMESIERIRAGPSQNGPRPEEMSPQELHATLWKVLTFRDNAMKTIAQTIEKIPGLSSLVEKISDSVAVFVLTTIEPFVRPLLRTATSGLSAASQEVIDTGDQYEVFNDPRASDPTHSILSKDHFDLILNEPAGEVAKAIVIHAVNLVTKAWDDESVNVQEVIEDILSCLFHPDFHNPNSKVQSDMLRCMRSWVDGLGHKRDGTLSRLTKEAVRNHRNVRAAGEGGPSSSQDTIAAAEGHTMQQQILGYAQNIPGLGLASSLLMDNAGKRDGQYTAVANTGRSTPYYATSTSETAYTPGYTTESTYSTYSSYQPPSSQPGYAPSYTPSYLPPPDGPPEPNFSGFPDTEPVRHGHHGHRLDQDVHEPHRQRHGPHYGHHHEDPGHEYGNVGGFVEAGPGEMYPSRSHPRPDFPAAESYGATSQAPQYPGTPPASEGSYQYGWR